MSVGVVCMGGAAGGAAAGAERDLPPRRAAGVPGKEKFQTRRKRPEIFYVRDLG